MKKDQNAKKLLSMLDEKAERLHRWGDNGPDIRIKAMKAKRLA